MQDNKAPERYDLSRDIEHERLGLADGLRGDLPNPYGSRLYQLGYQRGQKMLQNIRENAPKYSNLSRVRSIELIDITPSETKQPSESDIVDLGKILREEKIMI